MDRTDGVHWRAVGDLAGGVAFCLGTPGGIGYSLQRRPGPAALGFAVVLAGAAPVLRWFRHRAPPS